MVMNALPLAGQQAAPAGELSRPELFIASLIVGMRIATMALLAVIVAGMTLAMLGIFRPWYVVAGSTIVLLGLAKLRGPGAEAATFQPPERGEAWVVGLTLLALLGVGATNAAFSGEHVFVDRDPAVYLSTGEWLAQRGTLEIPGRPASGPLSRSDLFGYETPGFYAPDPGDVIYPQFMHALPVILAVASWVGGTWLTLKVSALITVGALVWFFLLARQLLGSTRWASLATIALALLAPQVFVARDLYSETLVELLLLAFVYEVTSGPDRLPVRRALYAGLLLGATLAVRIDGLLILIAVAVYALFLFGRQAWGATSDDRSAVINVKSWSALGGGMAVTAGIGVIDVALFSQPYFLAHLNQIVGLIVVLATVVGGFLLVVLFHPRDRLVRFVSIWGSYLGRALTLGIIAVGAFAYALRPLLGRDENGERLGPVELVQAREGLPIEPFRLYSEYSLRWVAWYIGVPAVVLGLLGFARLVPRVLQRRNENWTLPVFLCGIAGVPYLWKPQITPDHLWAMRRFISAFIPMVMLLVVWQAKEFLAATTRRWTRIGLASALGMMILLPIMQVSAPLATMTTHVGFLGAIESICSALPADAQVITVGRLDSLRLSQPIRSFCGNDVASLNGAYSVWSAQDALEEIASEGRDIYLLSDGSYAPACGWNKHVLTVSLAYSIPERTLMRPPAGPEGLDLTVSLSRFAAEAVEDSTVAPLRSGVLFDGDGYVEIEGIDTSIPGSHARAIEVIVSTSWTPPSGSALLVAADGYPGAWWIEYRPDGSLEFYVTTEGGLAVVRSPSALLGDGRFHRIDVVFDDHQLAMYCDGSLIDRSDTPGQPVKSNRGNLTVGRGLGTTFGNHDMVAMVDEISTGSVDNWTPSTWDGQIDVEDRWSFDSNSDTDLGGAVGEPGTAALVGVDLFGPPD